MRSSRDVVARAGLVGVLACLALSAPAAAQDAPADPAVAPAEPAAAATAEQKLQAQVLTVSGKNASWRPAGGEWRAAQPGDILDEGAEIDVGLRSSMGLRVGKNATLNIQRMTKLTLAQLVESNGVLTTRAAMPRGKTDFKVDQVGLENDFAAVLPSATMSVEGTGGRIEYGGFFGTQISGVPTNQLRAIEVEYFRLNQAVVVSQQGATREGTPNPVDGAKLDTIGPPPPVASVEPGQTGNIADIGFVPDATGDDGLNVTAALTTSTAINAFAVTFQGGEFVPPFAPGVPGIPGSGNAGGSGGSGGGGGGGSIGGSTGAGRTERTGPRPE